MIEVESVSNENMSVFYIHCSNPELYSYLLLFIRNQKSHCHLKEPTPTPGGLHIVKILEILNKAVFELLIWIIPCSRVLGKMQCKTMVTFSALDMRELKLKKRTSFFCLFLNRN